MLSVQALQPTFNEPEEVEIEDDLAKYPSFQYAKTDVRLAGKRLKGSMLWLPETEDEIQLAFRVADSWRSSHMLPMQSIRRSLQAHLKHEKVNGFTAARAKRIASVRAKLLRIPSMKLDQIQDLGGCRAVVDDIEGVWKLLERVRGKFRHHQRSLSDYITSPKPDGYRSYHIVFDFVAGKDTHKIFEGRRIEVQIRTRLQHSWATAVEAVGLYRGENLKGGTGDQDWLRLFALLSEEFAWTERCRNDDGRDQRIEEIKALNEQLAAIKFLDGIKKTTSLLTNYVLSAGHQYYLISYDLRDRVASVRPYYDAVQGAEAFSKAEFGIEVNHEPFSSILVNVQTAKNLSEAYPGYFGDVSLFVENLRQICGGGEAVEFTLAPQEVVRQARATEKGDASMLRRHYTQWEEHTRKKKNTKKRKKR